MLTSWITEAPLGPLRGPLEGTYRDEEPRDAPRRHHGEIDPLESGAARPAHPGGEEGLEEVANGEDVRDVEDPAGNLALGDEDAGEEVEREDRDVRDRRRRALGGNEAGEREAEAAEGGGADRKGDEYCRHAIPRDAHAVGDPADRGQEDEHHDRDDERVPDPAGEEDPIGERGPAASLEDPELAVDRHAHREVLEGGGDHRQRDDRRDVVGADADADALDVNAVAAPEHQAEDDQEHHRERNREEDRGRVAPEGLLVEPELMESEGRAAHWATSSGASAVSSR